MEIKKTDNYRITNDFDEVFYVDDIYGFKNGLSVVKKMKSMAILTKKEILFVILNMKTHIILEMVWLRLKKTVNGALLTKKASLFVRLNMI